jgi:uncharacterized protein involved in exopolysaccharide biosynthesis
MRETLAHLEAPEPIRREKALTIADVVEIWTYRRSLFFQVFTGALVMGLLVVFLMPPLYEAAVTLEIRRDNRPSNYQMKSAPAESFSNVRNLERKEELNTEAEFVKSRPVIEQVVESRELTAEKMDYIHDFRKYVRYTYNWVLETAEWMYDEAKYALRMARRPTAEEARFLRHERYVENATNRLNVEALPDSDVLKITFRSSDPLLARDVGNAIAESYVEHRTKMRQATVENFFVAQADRVGEELRDWEKRLGDLRSRYAVYSVDEQRRLALEAATTSKIALKGSTTALEKAEARRKNLAAQMQSEPEMVVTEKGWDRNPALDEIERRLIELNLKRGSMLQNFQESSAAVAGIDLEIQAAKDTRKLLEASLEGKVLTARNPIRQRIVSEYLQNETEIAALASEVRSIAAHIKQYEEELEVLNRSELELNDLQRRVKNQELAYQLYLQNREQAKISGDLAGARLSEMRIISHASLPITPVRPRKWLYSGIALGVALLLGLLAVFMAEHDDQTLRRNPEILAELGLPLLSRIPEMPLYAMPAIGRAKEP